MAHTEQISILIVDDSRIFRQVLQQVLEGIPGVRVVGSVFSGEKALEFIDQTPPDLVTLDVLMPGLSGLQTLREISRKNGLRKSPAVDVLLVSALTQAGSGAAVEGLQLGALDFISKPTEGSEDSNREQLRLALIAKLETFRQRRGRGGGSPIVTGRSVLSAERRLAPQRGRFRAIAIGTSTGGPEALGMLLPQLARSVAEPIFIVQHILEGLTGYLADSLSRKCGRPVLEVNHSLPVARGIYLARSGQHLLVRRTDDGVRMVLADTPPEHGCRPSVNVFLRSAAAVYGSALVTVILTGMGDDGADGVRAVARAGGYVIAQDERSSVVWGMPRAAADTGAVDEILPLSRIADRLSCLVTAESAT